MSRTEDKEAIPPSAQGDPSAKSEHQDFSDPIILEGDEYKYETEFSLDDNEAIPDDHSLDSASESTRSQSDDDPPDPDRPNKFNGAASQWLQWTVRERDTASSLERLKAQDLSIHLYNAYALRARAKRLKAQGKRHARAWEGPKRWTAWPMDVTQVPQTSSVSIPNFHGFRRFTSLTRAHSDSRYNLQEEIRASFSRIARKTFEERNSQNLSEDEVRDPILQTSGRKGARSSKPPRTLSRQQNLEPPDSETESDLSESLLPDPMAEETDNTDMKVKSKAGSLTADITSKEGKISTDLAIKERYEPLPLVDDDAIRRIARPTINHLVSSVEVLLHGLHQVRQTKPYKSSFHKPGHKTGRWKRLAQSVSSPSSPRNGDLMPMSPAEDSLSDSSDSAPMRPLDMLEEAKPASQISSSSQSFSPPPANVIIAEQPAEGIGHVKNLQDWRDVLGVAAMQGWNAAVIGRAQARCRELFREPVETGNLTFDNEPEDPDLDASMTEPNDEQMEGGVHIDGFLKPIKRRLGWHEAQGNWKPWGLGLGNRLRKRKETEAVRNSDEDAEMESLDPKEPDE